MNKKISFLLILSFTFIFCLFSAVSAHALDADGDGILDDGDSSGVVGDNTCTAGNTINCDDNCLTSYNPEQHDSDGDGRGDACEDNAIDFTSVNYGHIIVEDAGLPDISGSGFTIEAMIKTHSTSTPQITGTIFSFFDDMGEGIKLWLEGSVPVFSSDADVRGGGALSPYTWYHVAAVLADSAHVHPESASCTSAAMAEVPHLDIYINGQFENCASSGSSYADFIPDHIVIGAETEWRFSRPKNLANMFNGEIDEVRFWTVARTGQEIADCMNYELGTMPGCEIDPAVLKGYWRLDEGAGSLAGDSSGNGFDGVIGDSYYLDVPWDGGWVSGYPFMDTDMDSDGDGYSLREGDCNDADDEIYPGAADVCDGKDNDCDIGTADGSAEVWFGLACDGNDTDFCEEGFYECAGGVQNCLDETSDEVEICDGVDNDCDGGIDNLGTITCGAGVCERTVEKCIGGQEQVCVPGDPDEPIELSCGDGLDNDCNALIDLDDPECTGADNAIDFTKVYYGHILVEDAGLPDVSGSGFTIEAMIKPHATSTPEITGTIFSYLDELGNGIKLWLEGNIPVFSSDAEVRGSGALAADTWYHVAAVLAESAHAHPESASCTSAAMAEVPHMDIYVNGQFEDCASSASSYADFASDQMVIGAEAEWRYNSWRLLNMFKGEIDEVRFWTVARTGQEIADCMNYELGTIPGCEIDPAVLKGYWRLDEGEGSLAGDSSGNGFTGVIADSYYVGNNPWDGGWVIGYPFMDTDADVDGDGYSLRDGDCNDSDDEIYPGATDVCDGKDNDCNIGTADGSAEAWFGLACDGIDTDFCEEGFYECLDGAQHCYDETGDEVEVCDGVDNDCDGAVDDLGTITCGAGVCERTVDRCIGGQEQTCVPGDPEEPIELSCEDGIDNDCNTFTDIADPECSGADNAIDFTKAYYGHILVEDAGLPDVSGRGFTIEAMVKPLATSTPQVTGTVFSYLDEVGEGIKLWLEDNVPVFDAGTEVRGNGALAGYTWYHVAAVLSDSAHTHPESASCTSTAMSEVPHMDIYINGQFEDCASSGSSYPGFASDRMVIGAEAEWRHNRWSLLNMFNGEIDEVRFWTVARTGQEIADCMNYELGTIPGCDIDPAVLKGYWRLDEGFGSFAGDSSGNGFSGAIQNDHYLKDPWDGGWVTGYPFMDTDVDSDNDGHTLRDGDCNDADDEIYPGAADVCDGKDNDCYIGTADGSAETWFGLACDGNDTDFCEEGVYECLFGAQNCTDLTEDNEEVCDGVDNDCDGAVDDLVRTTTCGTGQCSNVGVEQCVFGEWMNDTCDPDQGATAEICDNIDNDCDGSVDEELTNQTMCGVGACLGNTGEIVCIAGSWVNNSCDPLEGAVTEISGNGVDDDCNPLTYDTMPDIDGDGDGYTEIQGDCDDTDSAVNPGAEEIMDNGIDDDCNMLTYDSDFDTDDDGDGYAENEGDSSPLVAMKMSLESVGNVLQIQGDCDDTNSAIYPGADEVPNNGIDDDCNAATHDSNPAIDDDMDGYSENEGDCDDTDPAVNPGAPEVLLNGKDDDCNAETTDEDQDDDSDGVMNSVDNCYLTPNPGQQDTDGDGYGNMCDCDLNNSGSVGVRDFKIFKAAWRSNETSPNWNANADFNSDGVVGVADYNILKSRWMTSEPWY